MPAGWILDILPHSIVAVLLLIQDCSALQQSAQVDRVSSHLTVECTTRALNFKTTIRFHRLKVESNNNFRCASIPVARMVPCTQSCHIHTVLAVFEYIFVYSGLSRLSSGVTRLQWAHVQVFQKGPLFPKKTFLKTASGKFWAPHSAGPACTARLIVTPLRLSEHCYITNDKLILFWCHVTIPSFIVSLWHKIPSSPSVVN